VTELTSFIAGLPKAELHVHHVGSASPRIVAELAARHEGRSPVPADPAALADYFAFRDFAHFIDVYLATVGLLRTAQDVRMLTYEVARDLSAQQVRYAELTMTPYTSVVRGIPIEAYTEAIEDARVAAERDHGVVLRWVYDVPGESGLESADATLSYALRHRPDITYRCATAVDHLLADTSPTDARESLWVPETSRTPADLPLRSCRCRGMIHRWR